MQQGRHAAANILRAAGGQPLLPFRYNDRGTMATIGWNRAVAEIRGLRLKGFVAWVAWAFLHVLMLIGFRNRLIVGFQWAWAYVTRNRAARLITETAESR
jgi:NADH dehydrogenase